MPDCLELELYYNKWFKNELIKFTHGGFSYSNSFADMVMLPKGTIDVVMSIHAQNVTQGNPPVV